MENSLDNFEKTLSVTLFLCSIVSCLMGLITTCLNRSSLEVIHLINFIIICVDLAVITCGGLVLIFIFKKYSHFNFATTLFTSIIIFPSLFIFSEGAIGWFSFYLFLPATIYGVIIRKPWQITFPIITLLVYLIVFRIAIYGNTEICNYAILRQVSPARLYLSFISVYLFIFAFTYMSAKFALKSRADYISLASKDELTGIYNRRSLDIALNNGNYRFGIMIDIDNFKQINDLYGHQAGDKVLKELSDIILKYCTNEFSIYRYGGEEFFILSRFNKDDTFNKISFIYQDIHSNLSILGRDITISCGVSENIDDTITDFVKKADEQLYLAKRNGKDCVFFKNAQHKL